ncbi:phytoene synthase [Alkalibacillus flavidus]|uniref:Phytoene synthase n=1 Tax=Alkalibacillus flavidus TaxID=546021 RepID=A0ABV2KUI1_9BACI
MILSQDFADACEQMMKKDSSSFYHAFKHLPSPRKEAVFIIYSFCRMIDDAVDEPETSPYTLDELENKFTHLNDAEGHFIWPALRFLFHHFSVTKDPFYTQFAGQRLDYEQTHYDTLEDLEEYCYRVAGSVGEMLLPVLHDAPSERVTEAGIALGKGMQIVNIIRDVGEDQQLNRRYLPRDILEKHGYTLEDFDNQVVNEAFVDAIEALITQADDWFEQGLDGLDTYPDESALAIRLAAMYYREIIEVVREQDYHVFHERAIVSADRKASLFLRVINE